MQIRNEMVDLMCGRFVLQIEDEDDDEGFLDEEELSEGCHPSISYAIETSGSRSA